MKADERPGSPRETVLNCRDDACSGAWLICAISADRLAGMRRVSSGGCTGPEAFAWGRTVDFGPSVPMLGHLPLVRRDHRFDVDDRCTVDSLQRADPQPVTIDFQHGHPVHPDRVRACL